MNTNKNIMMTIMNTTKNMQSTRKIKVPKV